MNKNKYGLSRNIPSDIKLKIRQRCGFGCVICGSGIIQYEHVDPEFFEAREHNPDNMTLLCPQCHEKVTKGFWSKDRVKEAMKNPKCLQLNYCSEFFDVGSDGFCIEFSGSYIVGCKNIIKINSLPLLIIDYSKELSDRILISGIFCNSLGSITLKIIKNEWIAYSNNWDVTVIGNTITIFEDNKLVHLKLITQPLNKLVIEKLNMSLLGYTIKCDSGKLTTIRPNGDIIEIQSVCVYNCDTFLQL